MCQHSAGPTLGEYSATGHQLYFRKTSPRVSTLQVLPWESTQPLGISYTSVKHKELGGRFLETINYHMSVNC